MQTVGSLVLPPDVPVVRRLLIWLWALPVPVANVVRIYRVVGTAPVAPTRRTAVRLVRARTVPLTPPKVELAPMAVPTPVLMAALMPVLMTVLTPIAMPVPMVAIMTP